jgi:hypothetical protein
VVKPFAVVFLVVAGVGCGSSSNDSSGGTLETFSAYCVAGANAYCTRLYQCEPSTFPGSVASCEATPDENCGPKTCPAGTTYNSSNASTCVTAYQNEPCADVEAGDVPTGCTIAATSSNVCM